MLSRYTVAIGPAMLPAIVVNPASAPMSAENHHARGRRSSNHSPPRSRTSWNATSSRISQPIPCPRASLDVYFNATVPSTSPGRTQGRILARTRHCACCRYQATAKRSAKMSIGSSAPVEALAGKTPAMSGTISTPSPTMPVFEKPVRKAATAP